MTNSTATTTETTDIQSRITIPQLVPSTVVLSMAYDTSRERFIENDEKKNSTLLYLSSNREPFFERLDLWATMVIYGAMLREQNLPKKEEEQIEEVQIEDIQEEPVTQSGLRELAPQ